MISFSLLCFSTYNLFSYWQNICSWSSLRNVQDIPGLTNIDDFFDLAFNDDYLYELDLQLREKAISKFSKIKINNLKLFYNLDNRIIYNKNYSQGNTAKILNKYNLNKDSIYFELSEKGTSNWTNALSSMLQRYKESGYKIAIDDLGDGAVLSRRHRYFFHQQTKEKTSWNSYLLKASSVQPGNAANQLTLTPRFLKI